jgi:hypothetical protein
MAGQIGAAKLALQALPRAQPNISLSWIADHMPIKDDAEREHYFGSIPPRRLGLARVSTKI